MKAKRIIAAAMCLCMTAPMAVYSTGVPASASGTIVLDQQMYDIYLYKSYGDHVEITAVSTMASGDIVVPDKINDLPVTAIGEHAFYGCKAESVILPAAVSSIGKQAFANSSALKVVNIPSGVTEIKDETFLNCTSLDSVEMPDTVKTIGVRAFYNCNKLSKIDISSVETISTQAFDTCSSLEAVGLSESLTSLEEAVFNGCNAMTELTVPYSVTSIASRALPSSLKKLTIKNSECTIDTSTYMWNITDECVIYAAENSKAQEFAETYGFTFQPVDIEEPYLEMGDLDGENGCNVADLVILQKYLLRSGEIKYPQNADFTHDGVIDSFDLCMMRQHLLNVLIRLEPQPVFTAVNLSEGVNSNPVTGAEADEDFILGQTEFALSLLKKEVNDGKNTLISPYSAMQALAMTANGADNQTKAEMEKVLGGLPIEKLNEYLYTQRMSQPNDEKCSLKTANSIWSRDDDDRISVHPEFLQTNADYFSADVFKAPFDETTVTDINNWVNTNTDGMIPKLMDEIPSDAVMYLINAVAFEADWETPYTDTGDSVFMSYDGTRQDAEMMYSDETYYIKDENAVGIYKYYEGRRYAFAAVLPDEAMTVTEYINTLTPESLNEMLANPQSGLVYSVLPKFSYDFETDFIPALSEMGMPSAFNPYTADFSKMADTESGALFISKVKHKTHIDVFEEGTKAAAVTSVEMNDAADPPYDEFLRFDRPFVYCIVDTETDLPVFIGTLESIPD